MSKEISGKWYAVNTLTPKRFSCGFCDSIVAPNQGYFFESNIGYGTGHYFILICSFCNRPTFFEGPTQFPHPPTGNPVECLSEDVERLYEEARIAATFGAPTAAVMACRKLLMNVAFNKGAPENLKYEQYVDYLDTKGFVPPDGKEWVDEIRSKGNEANHKIPTITEDDAERILVFTEMLLKFIYEMPAKMRNKPTSTASVSAA